LATDRYTPTTTGDDHKFGESVQEVTERMTLLVREEIELAKAELEVKTKSLARGAAIGAAGGVFAVFGLMLFLFGVAFAWYDYVFQHIVWGFLITAGILFALAALAGFGASRLFKKGAPPTPDLAIEEAKRIRETVQSQGER
jgi:uncharacterized membrane protein YqjE